MNQRHLYPDMLGRLADANKRLWFAICGALAVLLLSIALNVVLAGRPADVIIVDKLGSATFYHEAASPEPAQLPEVRKFSTDWVELFLSRDAVKAKKHISRALSLCHPELQASLKAKLLDSGEIDRARDAGVATDTEIKRVEIRSDVGDRLEVEIEGTRTFSARSQGKVAEAFKMSLVLDRVRRTEATANGLVVRFIGGDFAPKEIAVAK